MLTFNFIILQLMEVSMESREGQLLTQLEN
jgi:hypothetical protein